jgi:hypothetical protein
MNRLGEKDEKIASILVYIGGSAMIGEASLHVPAAWWGYSIFVHSLKPHDGER